jgi:hypothetical protein
MATTTTNFGLTKPAVADRGWDVTLNGDLDQLDTLLSGHTRLGSGTPTIAAGTGAGTGPTVAIAGNDNAGVITVTTGTAPAASATVATITFGQAFGAIPRAVILTDAGPSAAVLSGAGKVYADQATLGLTSWQVKVGTTALTAATQYKWWYHVDP